MLSSEPAGEQRQHRSVIDDLGSDGLRSFARQFDHAIRNLLGSQCREHLRPGRLHLDQTQKLELLHGAVDFRGRDLTLPAERCGVRHSEKHQRNQGFPLIERQPDLFQNLGIRNVHLQVFYYHG